VTGQSGADDFVGREAALAVLSTAVEAASGGKGHTVLISGEAGIGKSRLAFEAAERAAAVTAWANCWEGEGAPAFWVWTQVLRTLAGDAGAAALPDLAGVAAGEDRFALFDGVADRLAAASAGAPVVLVIDDLQWADPGSLRLLRFVVRDRRTSRVAIVCTLREGAPLDDVVAESIAELVAGAVHVRLDGLTAGEVATLVRALGAGQIDLEDAGALHRRSGGNPFFIRELVRLPASAAAAVPAGVRAVTSVRVGQLSAPAKEVLTAGAVLGTEFDVADVGALVGLEGGVVLDAIDEARSAGLVVDRGRARAFAFVHAVIQEVLYDELRLADRARLETGAAQALERRLGRRGATAIAQHLLRAAVGHSDERTVEWAVRAAEESYVALAYEQAVTWYGHALALLPPAAGGALEAELLIKRGEASLAAGDVPGARETFRQAAAVAREVNDVERLARAALGLGSGTAGFDVPVWDRSHVALLEEALASLESSGDGAVRAQIQARLAVALWPTGAEERRRALSDDAVAVAREVGDVAVLASALSAHCDVIAGPEFAAVRHAEASEVIELAGRIGDRPLELLGLRHRLVASLELGDVGAADEDRVRFGQIADDLGQLIYRWYPPIWQGMRALMLGDLEDASRCHALAEQLGAEAHSDNAFLLAFTQWWMIKRYEGRFAEVAEATRSAAGFVPGATALVSGWSRVRLEAVIAAQLGQLDQARAHLDVLLRMGIADQARTSEWLPEMAQVAEVAALTEHRLAAEALLGLLTPHAERYCVEGAGAAFAGSVRWYLAMLARVVGDAAAADRLTAEAAEAHRRVGLVGDPPPLAPWPLADASTAVRPDEEAALVHEGTTWAATFGGDTRRLRDGKGMRDIAVLLTRQGQEVHCLELVGGVDVGGDHGPALDDRARREYQRRIGDLQADIEDARAANDPVRAERAEAELDALVEQLSQAFGLSGRARASGSAAERARSTVTTRIRSAIKHAVQTHPSLGRHLQHSVRTGTWCSYRPEYPVAWDVRRERRSV
jgi:tetratricopeptide (TPR) repeat protein